MWHQVVCFVHYVIVCSCLTPFIFTGASDGEERLGEDQYALHHLRQLHSPGYQAAGSYQYVMCSLVYFK